MATLRNKRNSMPTFSNKFMVSNRASMFEQQEATPQEKRDRSPCGVLEVSERKLEARKDQEKKKASMARRKRTADPYADQSSAPEDETINNMIKKTSCKHIPSAVSIPNIRKAMKGKLNIGQCSGCLKEEKLSKDTESSETAYIPVVWMCLFCGHQGCDRNSKHQHALNHYQKPRSDNHCLILSTQYWTVWCYECDGEVPANSNKKMHELVNMIKKKSDQSYTEEPPPSEDILSSLTAGRSRSAVRSKSPAVNTGRMRGSSAALIDEKAKAVVKLKGIVNLGNTCYLNSVLQVLSQTSILNSLLETQLETGHTIVLPGTVGEVTKDKNDNENNSEEEEGELKEMELHLPEGGALCLAFAHFLKELKGGRSMKLSPSHLLGQISKKYSQFKGRNQQDSHELLRCLLELLRVEELHRVKRAILKAFALSEKTDPSKVPSRTRQIIQGYGRQATHTLIDQIFGGQLISTVICEECQWSYQVFEPFMDLSLSISEDKGKPKSFSGSTENLFDSYGKSLSSKNPKAMSKYQLKKQKKLARKNRRNNINAQGKSTTPFRRKSENTEELLEENEEVLRRQTEQRRPGDEMNTPETLIGEDVEEETVAGDGTIESKRYKYLMAVRREEKKVDKSGGDSSEEEEEEEYDPTEDSDGVSLDKDDYNKSRRNTNILIERLNSLSRSRATVSMTDNRSEESSSEEESSEEESDEEESSDSSSCTNENVKRTTYSKKRENSDADEEDNADSEYPERMTRQPSIVVVDHSEDTEGCTETTTSDGRFLSTSTSCDHLNYNSASDTSERYYTADGLEEDVENGGRRRRGESKPKDLKQQRHSSSKESLPHHAPKGSDHYRSMDRLREEESKGGDTKRLRQEWLNRTLSTVGTKYQPTTMECSIMSGLAKFTAPELLANTNKINCSNCTKLKNSISDDTTPVMSAARKQMMIVCPPAVLTLQLKRFQNDGVRLIKINRHVHFPLVLDLAPFTSTIAMGQGCSLLYGLYGIVQHAGRLDGGHYTAFVRKKTDSTSTASHLTDRFLDNSKLEENPPPRITLPNMQPTQPSKEDLEKSIEKASWFHISDENVAQVSVNAVLKSQAYLLFYERLL